MSRNVFILGLDGLEYNFVEKWNLSNLKQCEYGRIAVPINKGTGLPSSPEVWASFLCGKHIPVDYGTSTFARQIVADMLKFVRKYVNLRLGLGKKVKVTKKKIEYFKSMMIEGYLKEKTFLDIISSEKFNVPYYNYDDKARAIVEAFGKRKLSLKETVVGLNLLFKIRREKILRRIETVQNADVFFAYTHYPDILQHLLFPTPLKIWQHYLDLEKFVSDLKSKLEGSTLLLIVSDHGFDFKKETHSSYGYYSSNVPLNPKPKKITDFYNIVMDSVK